MTREAKIGMLTGLGVIVLIGALLSEYLQPATGGAAAQNRMASLPIGEHYRTTVMQPPISPASVRSGGDSTTTTQNGAAADPIAVQLASLPPAYAADNNAAADNSLGGPAPGQPAVGAPVTPINDGRVVASAGGNAQPPVITVGDTQPISVPTSAGTVAGATAVKPVVMGQEYVIAPGDTLSKIAKKFFQSAKVEDQQRIVAANPATLKNVGTMLIAGRKLLIPGVPRAAAVVPAPVRSDPRAAVVIRTPGQTGSVSASPGARSLVPAGSVAAAAAPKAAAPKKAAATVYVVQDGDTLEKIAKKISAANYVDVAKQIAAMNKISDPRGLKIGMKLKLPAKV